jgi:gliding motility-associated-like protein
MMRKSFFATNLLTFLIFASSLLTGHTNAQVKRVLCNWNPAGQSTSQKVFPWSDYINPVITSSSMNYSGLITTSDSRFNFFANPTSSTINIGSNPYISFTINTGSNSIDLDRFVLQGFAEWAGQTSLRYSVDGYASHLGGVTKGSGYTLTSVDLSSLANISGSVEFRLYFYGTNSNATIWLVTGGAYSPSDSTPTNPYQGGSPAGLPTRYQWSSVSFWYTVPPPTVSSFTPTSGGIGSTVVLTGSDFTGATEVKFNTTNATSFTVNSSTQITATVPTGATTGPISVTTAGGTGISSSNFTVVAPPTVTSFTPSGGVAGAVITLTGTNFTGATAVRFNGIDAASFTVNSATQITATVPVGASTGTIAVTTPGGTATTSSSFTVFLPPTLSSFTPSSGAINSSVVITGTNFTGATAVNFNGVSATTFTVNSATQITARIPVGATTGAVSVTAPGGTVTSTTSITIGGEVLLEYPFNNSLAPSIGTGSATIVSPGTTTILGANSVCTDTNWDSIVRTAAIPLSSFSANAFQFDVDFSLPSLPSTTSFLLNSSNLGRDFGVKVSSQGRLSVYYRTPSPLQDIDSQFTNVQLVANTNYNLSVQFIANTIRMRLNGALVLVVDVADGLAVPSNPSFMFGDAFAARLPMSACIDNFRFIKDPLPFPFTDQLVISTTAFSSFEACVNSPSAAQTFSVSGTNLSNNTVVIRPPFSDYEISQNGTSYSSTTAISLTATAGTLNATTIFVRARSSSTAAVLSPSQNRILNIEVGSSNPLCRRSYILQGNISAQSPTISGSTSVMAGDSSTLTATTIPANSNAWVSSNTAIASISNTGVVTGLSPGSTTITYTNASGCTATQTITVTVGSTQTPVLNSPVSNTTGATSLNINYSLPENPLAGSVRLTFTPTAGGTPIVWTMTNATSVSFSHSVGTNPVVANPNNVLAGTALSFTNYNLTLSYQDAFGNPVAQITNTNIQTLASPSISFASSIQTTVVNRPVSITTINAGGGATFTITPALPVGLAMNSSTGLISGTPTTILASRLYTVTATNAAGTSAATFNLFIDADLDGDGIGDTTDPDIDGDGVPNSVEIQEGTSPTDSNDYKDSDGDGVPDYVEVQQNTDPNDPNDARDTDGDGVPDYVEILQGTNPNTPGDQLIDTDGDGVPDYVEVQQNTDPNDPNDARDTDGDGVPDYIEVRQGTNPNTPGDARDTDGDGIPDFIELQEGTDPNDPSDFKDDDGDGISNFEEGYNYQNPNNSIDTDGDGIPDYRDSDSDGDTILDINDAFPLDKNEWKDTDGDGIGDNADTDDDNDGILDVCDVDVNGDRIPDNGVDMDGDGIIDSCDTDRDGDGVNNTSDNCPDLPNTDQADRDRDGLGNVCDTIVLNAAQTFTPNGDGINDTWVVYNLENHPGSIVRVFNSNGKQVFYSANYKNDWNGNYQGSGEMLPIGSYLYQIDLDGDGSIDEQAWLYITK